MKFHNRCERVWQHSSISILYCTFVSKKIFPVLPCIPWTPYHAQRRHDKIRLQRHFSNSWESWNKHSLRGILPKSSTATPIFEGPMFRVLHKALHGNLRSLRPNVAFTTNKCQNWMYKVYAYKHTHTNAINQLIDYRTSTSVWDELRWLEYVNGKHGNTTQYRYWYLFASCQNMPKQQIKQKTLQAFDLMEWLLVAFWVRHHFQVLIWPIVGTCPTISLLLYTICKYLQSSFVSFVSFKRRSGSLAHLP